MRRAGWAEDEENRRLDCRNETSGQHSLRESVGAGTTGWSSKARERERETDTMQAPLILAIQCVLCLARPHLEEAHRPRHVFDHQVDKCLQVS